jgi:uncharacterized protein YbaA (DUF1428 family)
MAYIEGFLVPVPLANKERYIKSATGMVAMMKEFGVARFVETWGDEVPEGKVTDMRRAVKATADETVVFSWFEYPDKAARDGANAKMREDPRMEEMGKDMPFDGMRMIFGGFETLVEEGKGGGAAYFDGSVAPALASARDEYASHSRKVAKRLCELGALRCVEAWEDDIDDGKVTDFRRAVNGRPGEKIVFSWIEWPSRAVRDAAWPQIMADPSLMPNAQEQGAVDNQRRIFGGFEPILEA